MRNSKASQEKQVTSGEIHGEKSCWNPDDVQKNSGHIGDSNTKVDTDSDSESELELLDFKVAATEAIRAWNDKRVRMSRKQAKKVERLLSKKK